MGLTGGNKGVPKQFAGQKMYSMCTVHATPSFPVCTQWTPTCTRTRTIGWHGRDVCQGVRSQGRFKTFEPLSHKATTTVTGWNTMQCNRRGHATAQQMCARHGALALPQNHDRRHMIKQHQRNCHYVTISVAERPAQGEGVCHKGTGGKIHRSAKARGTRYRPREGGS